MEAMINRQYNILQVEISKFHLTICCILRPVFSVIIELKTYFNVSFSDYIIKDHFLYHIRNICIWSLKMLRIIRKQYWNIQLLSIYSVDCKCLTAEIADWTLYTCTEGTLTDQDRAKGMGRVLFPVSVHVTDLSCPYLIFKLLFKCSLLESK